MARSIEEVLKALEAGETEVTEVMEVIKSLHAENSKKNNEAKNLRDKFHEAQADAQKEKDNLAKVLSRLEIQLGEDGDIDKSIDSYIEMKKKELDDSLKTKPESEKEIVELRSSVKELKRDVDRLQKEKDETTRLAAAEKERRIKTDRDRMLLDALTEAKAIAPKELVALFTNKVRSKDDESVVYIDSDGGELTLKEGIAVYLKEHPEFVANSQTPGGGSGQQGKLIGGLFTMEQIKKMSPEEINKNWDKVQESLKNQS